MSLLSSLLLRVLHFFYASALLLRSYWKSSTWTPPLPVKSSRRRIPQHLAILLVLPPHQSLTHVEDAIVQSVVNAVGWCRAAGIEKLTVYERTGLLLGCTQSIREQVSASRVERDSSESEIEFPPTPPPSDYSESRPRSPLHGLPNAVPSTIIHIAESSLPREASTRKSIGKRRQRPNSHGTLKPLMLCLVSRASSKSAIASTASSLFQLRNCAATANYTQADSVDLFKLTVEELDLLLENKAGLASPDFLIVHSVSHSLVKQMPLELHGFPPWHIRLTEIYCNETRDRPRIGRDWRSGCLDETSFREALDEFAEAEMRFGK